MRDTIRFILFYILALIINNSIMFIFDRKVDLVDTFLLPLVVTVIIFLDFKTKEDKENK
ncbi:hypothetical protein [Staphylococcus simulans]|uniref:hypothetical protein n=1 Tax=Staphylococcus simulans TaxID=1286 RepID=UPI001304FDE0|nr:hypothetical protein [Staphylococcus simulans]